MLHDNYIEIIFMTSCLVVLFVFFFSFLLLIFNHASICGRNLRFITVAAFHRR